MLKAVADAHIFDEVGRVGMAGVACTMILHLQPARPRHKMHTIAANIGVWLAIPIKKHKGGRCRRQRRVNLVRRKKDAAARVHGETMVEQALAQGSAADLHPGCGQDTLGFGDDLVEHGLVGYF